MPGAQIRYLIKSREIVLGAMGFGAAAWKAAPRDQWIGWNSHHRQNRLHLIVNNARYLILPWIQVKNLASKILAIAARKLPEDWYYLYSYRPLLLETFVEKERFKGTCYRAANWIYLGETKGRGKLDVKHKHNLPIKDIYVYPVDKHAQKKLNQENLTYTSKTE